MAKKGKGRMRSHLIICAAAMGLVLGFAARGEAASYTFTKLEDTSGSFLRFGFPSINDGGRVAFSAALDTDNNNIVDGSGIFTSDGTTTTTIADNSSPFGLFGDPSFNDAGAVAFWATLDAGGNGIFTSDGTTTTTIADTSGPLGSFGTNPSVNDAGAVAFQAGLNIFTGSGGSTTTIADTSGPFSSLNFPSITNTGTVAFHAFLDAGGSGIFMSDGTTTTTVVDSSSTFSALSFPVTNNGGTVTFLGFDAGGSGVFTSNGGTLTSIADTSGPFTLFGTPSINDAGVVAFQAFISTGAGIFSGPDPIADKVIATGDPLDGSTVAGLAFSREGLNGAGQVAFFASLADRRQGVFLADPGDGGDPMPTPDPVPSPAPVPSPSSVPSDTKVKIDIKPNSMNLGSKGTTPVVIFGTDTFDATTVDPTTVQLEGSEVRMKGNGDSMASYSDFNGDGRLDLMVHVETEYLQQPTSATETDQIDLTLTGKTWDGATITGSDSVRIVP